jgi:hypothetical protein
VRQRQYRWPTTQVYHRGDRLSTGRFDTRSTHPVRASPSNCVTDQPTHGAKGENPTGLHPQDFSVVPKETAQVARAAFPKGNAYMTLRGLHKFRNRLLEHEAEQKLLEAQDEARLSRRQASLLRQGLVVLDERRPFLSASPMFRPTIGLHFPWPSDIMFTLPKRHFDPVWQPQPMLLLSDN